MSACTTPASESPRESLPLENSSLSAVLLTIERTPMGLLVFFLLFCLSGAYLGYQKYRALNETQKRMALSLRQPSLGKKDLLKALPKVEVEVEVEVEAEVKVEKKSAMTKKSPTRSRTQKTAHSKKNKRPILFSQSAIYQKRKEQPHFASVESSMSLPSSPESESRATSPSREINLPHEAPPMMTGYTAENLSIHPVEPSIKEQKHSESLLPLPRVTTASLPALGLEIESKSKIQKRALSLSPPFNKALESLSSRISKVFPATSFDLFIGGSMATRYCLEGVEAHDVDLYVLFNQPGSSAFATLLFHEFPGEIFTCKSEGYEVIQIKFFAEFPMPLGYKGEKFPENWDLNFYFPLSLKPEDQLNIEKIISQNPLNIGSEKIFHRTRNPTAELLFLECPEVKFQRPPPESPIEKHKFMQIALKQLGRFIYHGCSTELIKSETIFMLWEYLKLKDYKSPSTSNLSLIANSHTLSVSIYKKQTAHFILFNILFVAQYSSEKRHGYRANTQFFKKLSADLSAHKAGIFSSENPFLRGAVSTKEFSRPNPVYMDNTRP
jgi:hypothetical protein